MNPDSVSGRILKFLRDRSIEKGSFEVQVSEQALRQAFPDVEPREIRFAIEYLTRKGLVEPDNVGTPYDGLNLTISGMDQTEYCP